MNKVSHSHSTSHTKISHNNNNSEKILMEFIIFNKEKKDGIHSVNNIILRMMNEEQISELKDPLLIDHLMDELRLPQNPSKTRDDKTAFIYLNKNNIDFFKNEVIDFTPNDKFWFNPEIKIEQKEKTYETSYYNFYWSVLKKTRKDYLDKSDWMFLNIADRKIIIDKEKKEYYANLRQELRDINKIENKSLIKGYMRFNYDSWSVNGEFLKKFEPLLLC